ncbi:MAG: halocyanin domain-containing protein [Halohasta sp.]
MRFGFNTLGDHFQIERLGRDSMINTLNQSYGDRYLFAGTNSSEKPFENDGGGPGGVAYSPAGIWIDPGTTVIWEWTGEGGEHNVVTTDGPAELESELTAESGFTYEFEFTEDHAGITNYQCEPHASLGMLGAVAVGEDVPTVEVGGGAGGWPEDLAHDAGVPIQKHYVGIVSFLGIAVSLVFAFYVLKYGESPNTGQGGA